MTRALKSWRRLLLAPLLLQLGGVHAATLDQQREQAVQRARTGETAPALRTLQSLYARDNRPELLHDLITVAQWHGEDAYAAELADRLDLGTAPRHAVEAAARARRNQGRFAAAERTYAACVQRWRDAFDCRLGLALSRAEQGAVDAALADLKRLAADYPQSAEVHAALGYVHRRQARWGDAAAAYLAAADLAPDRPRPHIRLAILSLLDLGAPAQAQRLADQYPEALNPDERRRLQGDVAAQAVRHAGLSALPPEQRRSQSEQALTLLEREAIHALTRTRLDRLVALRQMERMDAVLQEHALLREEGVALPFYALNAVGDAHLALRQPEQAIECYRQSLQLEPKQVQPRLMLAFAYAEAERFDAAFATIEALVAETPPFAATGEENRDRLDAEIVAGLLYGYAGLHPEAMDRLETLARAAPLAADARATLATIYRWRGWPRRARDEYRVALGIHPEHLDAQLGIATTALDLHDLRQADAVISEARARHPQDRQVRRAHEALRRERGWHLSSDASRARSSGGSDVIASEELAIHTRLDSPLITPRLRAYAWQYHTQGEVAAGDADANLLGAGLTYRYRGLHVYGGVHGETDDSDTGAALGVEWAPDDHWTWRAAVDSYATEVPLAARRAGIDAEQAEFGASYRWDETRRVDVGALLMEFSDGNRRRALSGQLQQRLYTSAHLQVTGTLGLYASENSKRDAVYFNPESDASAHVGATVDWVTWRCYERAFIQQLRLGGGHYHQEDFGGDAVYEIGYGHEWRLSERLHLRYGIDWGSRVYDGERETGPALTAGFNWSFGS